MSDSSSLDTTFERAKALLSRYGVFTATAAFDGRFIGSIPLGLATSGSDADIVCMAQDLGAFAATMASAFGWAQFQASLEDWHDLPSAICRFNLDGLPVELYARQHGVTEHPAWRWFETGRRLLAMSGAPLLGKVRAGRAQGLKTEPAFGVALGLTGDIRAQFEELAFAPDSTLQALLKQGGF